MHRVHKKERVVKCTRRMELNRHLVDPKHESSKIRALMASKLKEFINMEGNARKGERDIKRALENDVTFGQNN